MNKNTTHSYFCGASKIIVSLSLFVFFALPASAQLYLADGATFSLANNSSLVSVLSNVVTNAGGTGVNLYNNGNLQLTGDFINNNPLLNQTGGGAAQSGTVHFLGTAAVEQISGNDLTGNASFFNVEINNTNAGSMLVYQNGVNTQVKNTLTFTSGRLRTDANPVGDGAAILKEIFISNTSPAAIVGDITVPATIAAGVTDKFIEGRLRWSTVAGNTYVFPIGTMKNAAPAGGSYGQQYTLVNSTASGDATVSFTEIPTGGFNIAPLSQYDCIGMIAAAGTLISCIINHGHWNLAPPAGSTMTVNLGEHGGAECQAGTSDHTFLTSTNSGATWIVNGMNGSNVYCSGPLGNPGTPISGILKRVTVTDPNSWLAEGASVTPILPIQLTTFTAEKYGDVQESLLNWSTATEQNSKDFELEWSADGIKWQTIGNVGAAGNSQTQKDYSFIHTYPVTGINYYQLREVDMNDAATFSDVREVTFTGNGSITITPNPAVNDAIIHCTYSNPHINFEVINVLGQRIASGLLTKNSVPMDLTTYPSGMYYFRFYVNNSTQVIPVVKQQ